MKLFNFLLPSLLFCGVLTAAPIDGAALPMNEFLQTLRSSGRGNGSYAKLQGKAVHLRGDDEPLETAIYFAVLLNPAKVMAQVIADNVEGYYVGQSGTNGRSGTTVVPMSKPGTRLANIGLRPSDLAMSFLYNEPLRELKPETVKMIKCRVFLLKDPESGEIVKIYASQAYFMTLKAEFFKSEADLAKPPFRTLEVTDFKQQNNLYYVSRLRLSGPGWRTIVEFDEAEVNTADPAKPPKIFRSL